MFALDLPARRSPRRPEFLLAGVTVVVVRAVRSGDVVQQADLRIAKVGDAAGPPLASSRECER